jgi:hypothetical protein
MAQRASTAFGSSVSGCRIQRVRMEEKKETSDPDDENRDEANGYPGQRLRSVSGDR